MKAAGQVNYVRTHTSLPLLFTACEDGFVRIFDLSANRVVNEMELHSGGATAVELSSDGLLFATAGKSSSPLSTRYLMTCVGYDGRVKVHDLSTMGLVADLDGGKEGDEGVWGLCWKGRRLAAGGGEGVVRVWDV